MWTLLPAPSPPNTHRPLAHPLYSIPTCLPAAAAQTSDGGAGDGGMLAGLPSPEEFIANLGTGANVAALQVSRRSCPHYSFAFQRCNDLDNFSTIKDGSA